MMRNTINQYQLQLKTWGKQVMWLAESKDGDLKPLVGMFLQEQVKAMAEAAGWRLATARRQSAPRQRGNSGAWLPCAVARSLTSPWPRRWLSRGG
jgi:hypothetical protein